MLKFELSGPEFEKEGTLFKFKRVTFNQVYAWDLQNSIMDDMSEKRQKEFQARSEKKESNWTYFTKKEQAELLKATPKFCIDFCIDVENLDSEIPYKEFSEDQKLLFWDVISEHNDFSDWLLKYKSGAEKKS